jgi:7,8-dihydroneopterin aldolase/epimerase/oxygenase
MRRGAAEMCRAAPTRTSTLTLTGPKALMNKIFVHDLRLETRIGVYDWEQHLPQSIRLDIDVGVPSDKPFESGKLEDALDYAAMIARIKVFAQDNPHPLLERFTEAIAQLILSEFGAPWVKVRVAKLAPLPGVKELGIEIERQR